MYGGHLLREVSVIRSKQMLVLEVKLCPQVFSSSAAALLAPLVHAE